MRLIQKLRVIFSNLFPLSQCVVVILTFANISQLYCRFLSNCVVRKNFTISVEIACRLHVICVSDVIRTRNIQEVDRRGDPDHRAESWPIHGQSYIWGTADILTKIYANIFIGTTISVFFTLRCWRLNTKRTQ